MNRFLNQVTAGGGGVDVGSGNIQGELLRGFAGQKSGFMADLMRRAMFFNPQRRTQLLGIGAGLRGFQNA